MAKIATQIQPVILAGGWGTRLWPLSRQKLPKQFLPILGSKTFFQATLDRISGLRNFDLDILDPIILCLDEYRFFVQEQCRELGIDPKLIIIEKTPKNSLPPLTLAALQVGDLLKDTTLLVLPADGYFADEYAFNQAIVTGVKWVAQHKIVSFGVTPETYMKDYGYAQMGKQLDQDVFQLAQFQSRPATHGNKAILTWEKSLWHLGIYLMQPSVFLTELETHNPDLLTTLRSANKKAETDPPFFFPSSQFETITPQSFERNFLEKTGKGVVIKVNSTWTDLGNWSRIHSVSDLDEENNSLTGDVISVDSTGNIVKATSRMVVTVGLNESAVIETSDAVLVSSLDKLDQGKEVIAELKAKNRPELTEHKRVFRPWGSYESIRQGEGFQVKSLMVNPGANLSLQAHRYRSEHWTVVRGVATVTCDDTILTLEPNQSTYIPLGAKHRLGNLGNEELEVIEVQCGSYLGEDDIIRFEDDFGRLED